ncbi:MAG: tetratricopeptide repeat protein [Pseudonocardiaceae bacterium]
MYDDAGAPGTAGPKAELGTDQSGIAVSTGSLGAAKGPERAHPEIAGGRATHYLVQHRDLHMNQGAALNHRVDECRPHRPSAPALWQPSRLLAAQSHVVDFTGRDRELAELAAWRDEPGLGLAVRLVHGPGGQGKTRLASEFAQRSAEVGWAVTDGVRRSYDTAPTGGADVEPVVAGRGLLVVVDHAECWPVADLLALAGDPVLRCGVPTRVLLLARPAGGWWASLAYWLQQRLDVPADAMTLAALADTAAARAEVFTAARDRFAALLGVIDPGRIAPPSSLGAHSFGLVLTVHMAALVAVDAYACGQVPPADPAGLSAYLLQRERDHWVSMFDHDQRVRTAPQTMGRAVFTATLTRPLPYLVGVAALARAGIPGPEQVMDDHRLCYPPGGGAATVCEPLYPDRLGEDFLALSTPGHTEAGYEPDPWATTTAAELLGPGGDGGLPVWAAAAVTVLIETARRWPHIARGQLFPLLRAQPQLAVAAGAAALARLTELPDVDLVVLEAIEALLPSGRKIDRDIAAAVLTTRLTPHRLATTPDPADRARLYSVLGYRLSHAGQRKQALAATVEAVEIYRRLAQTNPATVEPDLATALHNLGMTLSNLGRREDALATTAEAVEIYRRLAQTNPATVEPDLARALNNLGIRLSNLGQLEDALAATVEAVEIRRRLAQTNPAAYEPDLARGLWSFAWVRVAGQTELPQALTAAEESVVLYDGLAQRRPQAYTNDLRGARTTLADVLDGLDRGDEATEVRHRIEHRR